MGFTPDAHGVIATHIKRGLQHWIDAEGILMPAESLLGNFGKSNAFNLRGSAGEIFVDEFR
jgi:hypothetical protein